MLTKLRHAIGERTGRARRWRVLEAAPKNSVGAELGVYKGDFSREILYGIEPGELHLIDGWWLVEGDQYEHGWYEAEGMADTRAAYQQVEALRRQHPDQVAIHIGNDLEILKRFEDGYFDWVYLDSSHKYDHTVLELEELRRVVKPDGFIAGHDWYPDPREEHHGVYRAVTEFCDRYRWQNFWEDEWTQWAIRSTGTQT